jgi:hypothetical protein
LTSSLKRLRQLRSRKLARPPKKKRKERRLKLRDLKVRLPRRTRDQRSRSQSLQQNVFL